MTVHPFDPVWDENSRLLILGSFPSVKSRETGFYYGKRQNRFWPLMAKLLGESEPESVEAKKLLLLSHGIALWDVVKSCEITGSADASIKRAVPNELDAIISQSRIDRVYTNGKTAHMLYLRFRQLNPGIEDVCLPSTSPANAAWSMDRLYESWKAILG